MGVLAKCLHSRVRNKNEEVKSFFEVKGKFIKYTSFRQILFFVKNRTVLACGVASMVTCQELDIDNSMSFLNNFVETSLANGAREYMPPDEQMLAEEVGQE